LTLDACFSCFFISLVGAEGSTSVSPFPSSGTISLVHVKMESPDSDISPDADSSSADSTSADSSPTQALGDFQAVPAMEEISIIHNDDSASDVSMSTDSEDDDDDEVHLSTTSISAIPAIRDEALPASLDDVKLDTEASKKRKYSGLAETQNGEMSNSTIDEIRKRLKPDDGLQPHRTPEGYLRKDKSLLPPEIWSHIFTFCVPRVLGHLLPVNKAFHAYLDPSASGNSHEPLSRSALKILTPETIWRASRHLHLPGTPGPLAGRTELDMWKLACGTLCQFCGKKRQTNSTLPMVQWHPGPGENGVIPVWPFGILACGSCIQIRSTKVGSFIIIGFFTPVTSNSGLGNRFAPVICYSFPSDDSLTIYIPHQ
jgi:hypothetical protein